MYDVGISLLSLEDERVDQFLDYVKKTWTGTGSRFNRSNVSDLHLCVVAMLILCCFQWSHFTNDGPRTTNCVKGWHSKLNKRTVSHPSIYKLIEVLKNFQDEAQNDLRVLRRGKTVTVKNKKYEELDKVIASYRQQYASNVITREEFLDNVSDCLASKKV